LTRHERCDESRDSGQEIKLDGVEYLMMREDDVLAVVEDDDIKRQTNTKTK
jgi:hypothetical protein